MKNTYTRVCNGVSARLIGIAKLKEINFILQINVKYIRAMIIYSSRLIQCTRYRIFSALISQCVEYFVATINPLDLLQGVQYGFLFAIFVISTISADWYAHAVTLLSLACREPSRQAQAAPSMIAIIFQSAILVIIINLHD